MRFRSCFVIEKKQPTLHWGKKQVLSGRGGGGVGGERLLDSRARRSVGRERGKSMLDEDTTMWKEGERSFMKSQKGKKILFERYLATIKRLML